MSSYKIIVINLKKRIDRKSYIIDLFSRLNLKSYTFYEAIDGNNLELTLDIKNLFYGNDFSYRKCFIGCALSHYNIWLNLLKDNNNDYYIIFEDDIYINENLDFLKNFNLINDYVKNNESLDVLFMGFHKSNNNLNFDDNLDLNFIPFDNNLFNICGAFAYIITKNGSNKIINYIHHNNNDIKHGIKHGIDYLFKIIPDLNMTMTKPSIILSKWVQKISDNVDSDIQKDFNCFNIDTFYDYNNYIFYKNLDQINNDIKYYKTNRLQDLFDECEKLDDLSDGFNTLGFFKNRIESKTLVKSSWFNENDGIYIKLDRKQRVKVICNWTDSKSVCNMWNNQSKGNYTWNNIKLTSDTDLIDYYVIINYPNPNPNYNNEKYIPEKTIVFQMEPSCIGQNVNYGTKTWGIWANPDPNNFLEVMCHKKTHNGCQWSIVDTYTQLMTEEIEKKYDYISIICSSKTNDPGHLKRIEFLKYNDSLPNDEKIKIDIYGSVNKICPNLSSYKYYLEEHEKGMGLKPYKYYFMAENNQEYNYITEKLWEPIVSECLCFYYGAPNASDYINPLAFIPVDLNNLEETYKIMKNAIENDLWSQRIDIIKQEKYKVLNYYNFFPTIERIICKDLWKNNILSIIKSTKIIIISKKYKNEQLNHKIIPFIKTMEYFNIYIEIYNCCTNLQENNFNKNENTYKLIDIYRYITNKSNYENYLIIDDNMCLISSINNLFNHILFLPYNYDVCQLYDIATSDAPKKIIITKQYNSLYYYVKKYFFKCNGVHIISKEGIKKILKYYNNIDICCNSELFYNCYENINDFNFYVTNNNKNQLFKLS